MSMVDVRNIFCRADAAAGFGSREMTFRFLEDRITREAKSPFLAPMSSTTE